MIQTTYKILELIMIFDKETKHFYLINNQFHKTIVIQTTLCLLSVYIIHSV